MKMEVESGSRMEKVSDNSASSVSALSEGKVLQCAEYKLRNSYFFWEKVPLIWSLLGT